MLLSRSNRESRNAQRFSLGLHRLPMLVLALSCCVQQPAAQGQDASSDFLQQELTPELLEDYERKLNAILKTRRDEEREFVEKLVENLRAGKVPVKLVSTSYQWVNQKRPLTNYPFIYFEKVLRLQAERLQVEDAIPPFDLSIYKSAGQRAASQQLDAGQKTERQRQTLLEAARTRFAGLFQRDKPASEQTQ